MVKPLARPNRGVGTDACAREASNNVLMNVRCSASHVAHVAEAVLPDARSIDSTAQPAVVHAEVASAHITCAYTATPAARARVHAEVDEHCSSTSRGELEMLGISNSHMHAGNDGLRPSFPAPLGRTVLLHRPPPAGCVCATSFEVSLHTRTGSGCTVARRVLTPPVTRHSC